MQLPVRFTKGSWQNWAGRLVLFGGVNHSGFLDDTWEYDGTWVQRTPTTRPGGRVKHAMAYVASIDPTKIHASHQ